MGQIIAGTGEQPSVAQRLFVPDTSHLLCRGSGGLQRQSLTPGAGPPILPADHRIDLTKLKKNVGEFPVGERDQNAKWYGLYKQVDSDPSVVDSHKNYLLFRDIAAMSLLLVPIVPAVMYFSGLDTPRILISTAWFLGQYLVAAFAARTTGIRFVQNVLAVHASRKVTNSRKKEADG